MPLLPTLLKSLMTLRRRPWKIDLHVDILDNEVLFHLEDLGAFPPVVAMPTKRTVNGQSGRGKARKQTAKSRCTHGWGVPDEQKKNLQM